MLFVVSDRNMIDIVVLCEYDVVIVNLIVFISVGMIRC